MNECRTLTKVEGWVEGKALVSVISWSKLSGMVRRLSFGLFILSVLTVFGTLFGSLSWARTVDTEHDLDRLNGFWEHENWDHSFERNRKAGIKQLDDDRLAYEEYKRSQLGRFKAEKKVKEHVMEEGGPEYWQSVAERRREMEVARRNQSEFVRNRNMIRHKVNQKITFTEKREYGIDASETDENGRVEWSKRKFFATSGGSSGSGTGGFNPNNGSVTFPSRFDPPPPDYQGEFYDEVPPPPPPQPPVFDDVPPPPPPAF
jgi:hypothetical protein